MGSVGSSNPWAPYGGYRDCSQGICSIYCPQWCYLIFPPPPPFVPEDDSGNFSPLIIALIGILASAFLLITYYTVISKYCRRRRGSQNSVSELEANRDQTNRDQWRVVSAGLDEALIKSITVCKYKKGEALVEGTECAVCLGEFQEDESLRLLPKCSHAFHLPCIDTWLKSHSNCPLCRANVVSSNPLPPPAPTIESSSALNNDLILVVDDEETEEVASVVNDVAPKNTIQAISEMENSEIKHMQLIRRSISLGSFSCRGHLLGADILRINEDAENIQMDIGSSQGIRGENGVANSGNEVFDLVRSSVAMKRSISTGRFSFTRHDKGTNSIIPN